jgi:hypothetical protein
LPESMNKSAIQSTSKKSSYIHPLRSLDNKVDRIWHAASRMALTVSWESLSAVNYQYDLFKIAYFILKSSKPFWLILLYLFLFSF